MLGVKKKPAAKEPPVVDVKLTRTVELALREHERGDSNPLAQLCQRIPGLASKLGLDVHELEARSIAQTAADYDGAMEQANADLDAARKLMGNECLTRQQAMELRSAMRITSPLPKPSGVSCDQPFWTRDALVAWSETAERVRSAVAEQTRVAPRGFVRSRTWDATERTFSACCASEEPAIVFDARYGQDIREILLADGGQFKLETSLHIDHDTSINRLVGTASNPRREGTQWIVNCRLARDPYSLEIGGKVEAGVIRYLSIGYRNHAWEIVNPKTSATIKGRTFTNDGDVPLRVVTEWSVHEISLVSIPADSNASIRTAAPDTRNNSMSRLATPAIHSLNSLSDLPSVRALSMSLTMRQGVNDPTQCSYTRGDNGGPVRLAPSLDLERDADRASSLLHCRPWELLRMAMERDGVQFNSSERNTPGAILERGRMHYQGVRSFSASDLGELFVQSFYSLMLSTYDQAGDSTRGWCDESDVLSMKAEGRARLGGVKLSMHPRGAEANHVYFNATSEDVSLACYSAQFRIDEQDILDGSFGSIQQAAPQQMGDAARALRADLVYSYLARNPLMSDGNPLFDTSNHGNLLTSHALAEDKLQAALAAIGKQVDGPVNLNLRGEYVVVPTAIERTAQKLARDVELFNPDAQRPPIVRSDSRLDNGVIDPTDPTGETVHAGSASTWYASTAGRHALEVQYLAGKNRRPEVQSWFLEGGQFGVAFAVRHFIGVRAVGYKGIVKCTG
jgi:hypothetical protein